MQTQVYKCGGKFFVARIIISFFKELSENLKDKKNNTLFVISAMNGMTRLLRLVFMIKTEVKIDEDLKTLMISLCLSEFKRAHTNLIAELFTEDNNEIPLSDFEELYVSLEKSISAYQAITNKDEFYATILQYGELASSKILSNYINTLKFKNTWFDARDFVVTDNDAKEAVILNIKTEYQEMFKNNKILITQGFIGRDKDGHNVVVGFDGSDYSAACFANSLVGEDYETSLTFWKDVDGVYTDNPNKNPEAKLIPEMDRKAYARNAEVNNSFVVRPDSISNLAKNIEVTIRSFIDFENPGTKIK